METETGDGGEMSVPSKERRQRWRTLEEGARLPAYSQVSMSAEASFPVAPKWILMNFPWG